MTRACSLFSLFLVAHSTPTVYAGMSDEPANKKRRTSRTPSPLPGPSTTATLDGAPPPPAGAADAAIDTVASVAENLPDEEHGAPPSTAAGAHAKPLSALFNSQENLIARYSPKKKQVADADVKGPRGKGKGKGKENGATEEPEDFTQMLARLKEGGTFFLSLSLSFVRSAVLADHAPVCPLAAAAEESEGWGRPKAPTLNPSKDKFSAFPAALRNRDKFSSTDETKTL